MKNKLCLFAIAFCLAITVIKPICAEEEGNLFATPDKGWFYLQNVSGASMWYGDVVYYASATTVTYGDDCRTGSQSTTLVAGVVMDSEVKNNAIARIQVRGYHPDVRVTGRDEISIGDILIPSGYGVRKVNATTDEADSRILPQFVALEALPAHEREGVDEDSTPASQEAVKCMLNIR